MLNHRELVDIVRNSGGQVRVCEPAAPQARALAVAHRRRADALLSHRHHSVCAAARSLLTACRLLAVTRRHRSARRPKELTCFCGTTGANVFHCSVVCVKFSSSSSSFSSSGPPNVINSRVVPPPGQVRRRSNTGRHSILSRARGRRVYKHALGVSEPFRDEHHGSRFAATIRSAGGVLFGS